MIHNHTFDKQDGGIFVIQTDIDPILFNVIGQEHIYLVDNLTDLKDINKFTYQSEGVLPERRFEVYYSLSKNLNDWSEYIPLNENVEFNAPINIGDTYHVRIKWVRVGNNPDGQLVLRDFRLEGKWDRPEQQHLNPAVITLEQPGQEVFYTPPNIYKAFRIDDFEIFTTELSPDNQLAIQYRISQDSGRRWSAWEDLTKENISTFPINPIRFFMIEYKLTKVGTDEYNKIKIFDLNLKGDFQNVSLDYYKTNLLGIRDCCVGGGVGPEAEWVNGAKAAGVGGTDVECALPPALRGIIDDDKKSMLFNPYDIGKATQLYSGLSNLSNEIGRAHV